jgi:2-dehydro-3-deoxyglucarate aldolase
MNRVEKLVAIRGILASGGSSIGGWIQIPHPSIAEIIGQAGYDWVAIDMEHGAIGLHQLPDLCRALELGDTLPIIRLASACGTACKQALDAGAGGVIVPMVTSATQLVAIRDSCRWPPSGRRGVGFSRANLFGKHFQHYHNEAQSPLLVAMIESVDAVDDLDNILKVEGLDAILIGPYDLSASLGITGQFDHPRFAETIEGIRSLADKRCVAYGIHVVNPSKLELGSRLSEGYRFTAFTTDSIILRTFYESDAVKLFDNN